MTDCPNDTNGVGRCGRWLCSYCGENRPPIDCDRSGVFFTADVGLMTPVQARRVANVLLHRASQVDAFKSRGD